MKSLILDGLCLPFQSSLTKMPPCSLPPALLVIQLLSFLRQDPCIYASLFPNKSLFLSSPILILLLKLKLNQCPLRWLDSITNSMDMNFSKLQEGAENREAWCVAVHGVTKSRPTQQLNNSISLGNASLTSFSTQDVLKSTPNAPCTSPLQHSLKLLSLHL